MIYSLFITPPLLHTQHKVHTHRAVPPSPMAGCPSAVPGHVRASVMGLGGGEEKILVGYVEKTKRGNWR